MSDDLGYASLVDTMLCPKFVTHFPKVGKHTGISCDNQGGGSYFLKVT